MNLPKVLLTRMSPETLGGPILYRTAGYRVPEMDEEYVSTTGSIVRRKSRHETAGPRLIVRPYDPIKDFVKEIGVSPS